MEELERLKDKIRNAHDLQTVVKMMKTISAANIREYGQAVESLARYNETIEMGLQVLMRNEPETLLMVKPMEETRRLGAVIFGSDQGLAGRFNEQIAAFAIARMKEAGNRERTALAVGERIMPILEEAGQRVEAHFSFSEGHMGLTQVMTDVFLKIEEWREQERIDRIVLFHNHLLSGSSFAPQMVNLFPLDLDWIRGLSEKKWPARSLPTFSMDADQLFSSLVRQYLFFLLYRAFVESIASENASRLLAMQMAEKNIEDHLKELTVQFNRQRQEAISEELLDIVTGFEALTSG